MSGHDWAVSFVASQPRGRRLAALGIALALLLPTAAPVGAVGSPTRIPFDFGDFTLADVCDGFPVNLHAVVNKQVDKVFHNADGTFLRTQGNGLLVIRATNEATGKYVDVDASGPSKVSRTTDGLHFFNGGRSLWWAYPGEPTGPDLWLAIGPVSAEFTLDWELVSITRSPNEIHLCPLLAG